MPGGGDQPSDAAAGGQTPGKAGTPRVSVEDAFAKLRQRVNQNQISLQGSVDQLADDARKAREMNAQQFGNINAVLNDILSKLPTASTSAAATTTTATEAANTQATTATDTTETTSESSFGGFPDRHENGSAGAATLSAATSEVSLGSNSVARQAPRKLHSLPKFSGDPEQWPKFIMRYRQTTEAYGYSAIDNSLRLQESLSGDALDAVDTMLNDSNLTDAVVDELERRFGRPELLAQIQLQRVREVLPIPESRPELLVPYSSRVTNMFSYVNKPKTKKYLDNPELLEELVAKLPLSYKHSWSDFAVDAEMGPSVQLFVEWLKEQTRKVALITSAAKMAAATLPTGQTARPRQQQSSAPHRRDRLNLVSTHNDRNCGVCGMHNHESHKCRRFIDMSVDARWKVVKEKRLCFSCLRHGHGLIHCEQKRPCTVVNCARQHHPLLHSSGNSQQSANINTTSHTIDTNPPRRNPFDRQSSSTSQPEAQLDSNRERCNTSQLSSSSSIMYRIVPIKLYGPNCTVQSFAFIDDGSSVSLIDESLAEELGLGGPQTTLDLQWFGGQCATEMSRTVELRIGSIRGATSYSISNVRTVRKLELPTQSICVNDLVQRFECLRGLPLDSYHHAAPRILIGLDNVHLGVPTRHVACAEPGLVATRTKLGWVLCGPERPSSATRGVVSHIQTSSEQMQNVEQMVNDYFSLENFGVRHAEELVSRDDARAHDILRKTTKQIGERYETGLLWRNDTVEFPPSREMAMRRLLSVERRMKRDEMFAKEYKAIMDGYLEKGYARRLTTNEAAQIDTNAWYLPHFAVTNVNKPGKLRIVFDAAAMANGVSLNAQLMKGPDLNKPMLAVLHAFRMGSVGVCADIKEMFPQIRIREDDVQAQRYLWRGGDDTQPIATYAMQSMIFGAACSPCCAQYVKNINADKYADQFPDAVRLIHDAHYVDDFVASFDTEAEAAEQTKQIVDIHKRGGFELRGFLSNSEMVLQAVDVHTADNVPVNMELDTCADKVLGMYWCTKSDAFLFRLTFNRVDTAVVDGSRRPTKREMLSTLMSIFDPFGILANFAIYAKLMLQELWKHGTKWDEPIPAEIAKKWSQWLAKLEVCRQVRVPRCYDPMLTKCAVQLHIFADASQEAFATVAYWRVEVAPSQWRLVFITGKSRCAPPKLMSIPRLELQAAILAVRINRSIRSLHDFPIERTFFWTDSKTVVHWVRSDKLQFRPFVAHRIAEILEETTISQWRWVPTAHNVADDATRAKYPVRFDAQNRWIRGPDFLLQDEEHWPQEPAQTPCVDGAEEVKPSSAQMVCVMKDASVVPSTRFSNFFRARRAMAFVLRFVRNLRPSTRRQGELQPDELEEAERRLIIAAQEDAFAVETDNLKRGKPIDRKSSLRKLLPHIDKDGVLRVTGRMDKAEHLPSDLRNPIILPKGHHLTTLVVSMFHRQLRHQQAAAVVCEIRRKYWVPHLPMLVRRVRAECMLCRIKSARAITPVMGQLPIDRLTPYVRPFTYTGVDYFGPVFVAVGRRREKRWVALFTCLTVRAVHLELALDLSTDAFILCLRNFINLRGCPKQIRSDNGTNFVGASRELKEAVDLLDHDSIQRELGQKNIRWLFNCPGNPEAGGCWERLVQSIKRVLSVSLKEIAPQVETFRSLLIEAANIVNSRPLTHLPIDNEEDEPLSPNHLLLGTANSTQTPGPVDERPICMRKQWRIAQALKDRFWKRWLLEYLPDLTRRAKGYEEQPNLEVGALVLIIDPLLSRGQWRRGRVIDVCEGPDGRVRTATVKTSDGELRRPVSKLAVLSIL